MSKYEAFFGLPSQVRFCKKCVISNQRPSSAVEFKHHLNVKKDVIDFDERNVCSACRFNDVKIQHIDWDKRQAILERFLAHHRSKNGEYDCVVPGSGGKDSSFTAHILKHKFGMNPLTVTWAPHLYTDIGWRNFTNWMHKGGLDNLLYTPNGELHRLITKLAFKNLCHPFQPFIVGQRIIGPAIARRYGIKLVFYGENQAEYGNRVDENEVPEMKPSFFVTDDPETMHFGGVSMREIIARYGFTKGDFAPYIPPLKSELEEAGVEVHYLGYYLRWDPQECYYYAVENTGFEANTERSEGRTARGFFHIMGRSTLSMWKVLQRGIYINFPLFGSM